MTALKIAAGVVAYAALVLFVAAVIAAGGDDDTDPFDVEIARILNGTSR